MNTAHFAIPSSRPLELNDGQIAPNRCFYLLLSSVANQEGNQTIRGILMMKKEYDFSKGERGKFYHTDVQLNLPVYLEPEIAEFIRKYAKEKNVDTETIVNEWLRNNIAVIRSVL